MLSVHPAKQVQHLGHRHRIERAGRFVGDQQTRTVQKRQPYQQPLRLPHAQLAWVTSQKSVVGRQTHRRQSLHRPAPPGSTRVRPPCVSEVSPQRQRRVQRSHRTLRHQRHLPSPHPPPFALRQSQQIASPPPHLALRPPALQTNQPQQSQTQRTLARPRWPNQRQNLALPHRNLHLMQSRRLVRVMHAQPGSQNLVTHDQRALR